MLKNRLAQLLVLLFALVSTSAHAFFDPPYITPSSPAAGQTISVNVYGGGCDAIIGVQGYPQISQQGNAIRILFNGVRETDPEFCTFGVGTATSPVGAYPAGSYTLQVDLRYPNIGGEFVIDTLGIVPFFVTGAVVAPVAAPTMTWIGLLVLGLVVMGFGAWNIRRKRLEVLLILLVCLTLPPRNVSLAV